jgi:SAM-dependent MidA family methyltransferase
MVQLPAPGPEAAAHSRVLTEFIKDRIVEAGGWISFAEYMSLALYAPGLGYYTAGARKFGAGGDFVTAPELTPLFGQVVAAQAAQVLEAVGGGDILELGAGSGRLAVDMLLELERLERLPDRYFILDVSADLRERQQALISAEIPQLTNRVVWLDALPESFSGFIVGNEVLDALPVHLLHWQSGTVWERGVAWPSGTGFAWEDRLLTGGRLFDTAQRLPIHGLDYLSEVNLAASALVHSLAACLVRGLILFLDYGFPRAEYYHPDRRMGTLICHYRHQAYDAPFFLPGLADLTAHVDFTAVADAALEAGLDVPGYTSQAHFLVNCGVLACLERLDPGSVPYLKQAAGVQKLIQPSEMGELFKVAALAKALDISPIGFEVGDKRHTL